MDNSEDLIRGAKFVFAFGLIAGTVVISIIAIALWELAKWAIK